MGFSLKTSLIYLLQLALLGTCQLHHVVHVDGRAVHNNLHTAQAIGSASSGQKIHNNLNRRDTALSRFTYFATGLGACGTYNKPTDFVRGFCVFECLLQSH